MLPMKRPYEPQDIPESPEQPRKKARLMDTEISTQQMLNVSPVNFAKQEEVMAISSTSKKARKKSRIPHIDFVHMQHLQRESSLKIQVVGKSNSALDLPRLEYAPNEM